MALSCSGTFLSSTHSLRCARSSKQVDRLSYYHNRKKRILVLTDAALILLKRKGKRENYQAHRNILSIVYLLLILDWKNKFFCVITIRFRVELTRFQKMTAWNSFHSSRFYPFFFFLRTRGKKKTGFTMRMNCFGDKVSSSGSFHCKIVLLDEQQLVHEILVSRRRNWWSHLLWNWFLYLSFVGWRRPSSKFKRSCPAIYGHRHHAHKKKTVSFIIKRGKVESERISCIITLTEIFVIKQSLRSPSINLFYSRKKLVSW